MQNHKTESQFLVKNGESNTAFELRTNELRVLSNQEVLIEVEAYGLNYADVMARLGLYKEAPPLPCVIGYEVVGYVIEVNGDENQHLVGKRVVAFCRFGGYAKHVITNTSAICVVEKQPAEELLALSTQAVTAYYMTDYISPVRKNDIVLIHAAAGGVGSILIQLAKRKGATVIAKVGNSAKVDLVKALGADYVVNYNDSEYSKQIEKILDGKKLDVSFNPVAGSTFKKDISLLNATGRLFLFGGSELSRGKWGIFSKLNFIKKMGLMPPIGWMMMAKSIIGINMLKVADHKPEVISECLQSVVSLYNDGKIKPQVGGVFKASELSKAHDLLEGGSTVGKLTVYWK